jgi:lipoprotein NlpI
LNLRLKYPQSLPDFAAAVHGWKDDWRKMVGLFLAGEIHEASFLALADQGDAKTVQGHQCEAFYYVGMVRLFQGETATAQTFFEKCLATGVSNFVEYDFASAELARLRAKH